MDADGNGLVGIRSVFKQVPIGTYTGWNLLRAGHLQGGMCKLQGPSIPFAATPYSASRLGNAGPLAEIRPAVCRVAQARDGPHCFTFVGWDTLWHPTSTPTKVASSRFETTS